MSEAKLISPLLDGFVMGEALSDRNGVRCYPAMNCETEKKYIVKVISIPESQVKLEALLLAGAFSDKDAALQYYKDLSQDLVNEAVLLQRLSRLEGFAAPESWQVVPMEEGTGFDVYLLTPYRPTLERRFRREPMTHLAAVNLGLDLCAAMAVCRRSGYMYADLKPGNIMLSDQGYRIGDLGFISLSSLRFASLPQRYISAYTAPEVTDAYSALTDTMDIYALGLVLYQIYNGGNLPFEGRAPETPLDPPEFADYEMAQIILKACAPKAEDRWQDPAQMGQALVGYMQRNGANDTPIVPPVIPAEPEVQLSDELPAEDAEPTTQDILDEVDQVLDAVAVTAAENADLHEIQPEEETPAEENEEAAEDAPEGNDELPAEETNAEASEEAIPEAVPVAIPGFFPEEESVEEIAPVEEELPVEETATEEFPAEEAEEEDIDILPELLMEEEPVFIPAEAEDVPEAEEDAPEAEAESEALPEEEAAPVIEEAETTLEENSDGEPKPEITDEVSQMLAQADELLAMEAPEPAVAPAPIDVPIPPLPGQEEELSAEEEEPSALAEAPEADIAEELPEEFDEEEPEEEEEDELPVGAPAEDDEEGGTSTIKKLVIALVCIVTAAILLVGGWLFYKYYYQQPILGLHLSGEEDRLTVTLNTQIDDELLTVICTDPYGNTKRANVVNGVADFEGLGPDTSYRVHVEISGFHELVGLSTGIHVTSKQTNIVGFNAVTGNMDGSVILSFTVEGPDTTDWVISYSTEGEAQKSVHFTGHVVTINGLTLNKEYTFHLEPVADLYVVGNDTVTYSSTRLIYPENLAIQGFRDGALTVTWDAPEGIEVNNWVVRCYNEMGFDKTITVQDTTAVFEGLSSVYAYTVEVKAEGMTNGQRDFVSANSVTVQNIVINSADPNKLYVTWEYEGNAPEGGWLLMYTIDGGDEHVVQCTGNSGVIAPVVPGSTYRISIQCAGGNTVFGGETEYSAPAAQTFSGYLVEASHLSFRMCITPTKSGWDHGDVPSGSYTTTFVKGQSASFVIRVNHEYNTSSNKITTLYLIRDSEGKIVSTDTTTQSWTSMWYRGYGEMTIPNMPQQAGAYSITIYFNGMLVTTQNFTVTE